jgi:hypothetical protein
MQAPERRPVMPRLRALHRDESGQISLIMVLGAVALVALLGMVVTTGDQSAVKMHAQNAVDAAALTGGAWVARGLNVISAFNIMETQLVGAAILLEALTVTIPVIVSELLEELAGLFWCPLCEAYVLGEIEVLGLIEEPVASFTAEVATCPGGVFWVLAGTLSALSVVVDHTFMPVAIGATLTLIGSESWGEKDAGAIFIPGPALHGDLGDAVHLPVTADTKLGDLCGPMLDGGPGYQLLGYPEGVGPFTSGENKLGWALTLLSLTALPPAYFVLEGIADGLMWGTCSGALCNPEPPVHPLLLDASNDGLHFITVAWAGNRNLFFSDGFSPLRTTVYTYSQVEVYNGTTDDQQNSMFTQDWRVRLEPAGLLNQLADNPGAATNGFGSFLQSIVDADLSVLLEHTNNH